MKSFPVNEENAIVFPRMLTRKDSLLVALFLVVLIGGLSCMVLLTTEPSDAIIMAIPLGFAVLFVPGVFLWWGITTVTIKESGIALSVGRFIVRRLSAEEIKTVAKFSGGAKAEIPKLVISTVSAEDIEAAGEKALRQKPIVRSELKFREGKSDWKDLCLNEGLRIKTGFWMEFSPERQQLLREMFPNAAHREAKRYNVPPSLQ